MPTIAEPIARSARFSGDRIYRYTLERIWDDAKPYCQFVGLNCSTADETLDDPTVRRCIRFARDWDFGGLVMTNLFAFRATDPNVMKAHYSGLSPEARRHQIEENFGHIQRVAKHAGLVVCAWGVHGAFCEAGEQLRSSMSVPLHHLGLTKDSHPRHPLYLRADRKPERWEA